ncbi:MAG TPA: NAD(P)H-dependent glycerol-3-phosphate dehydrogenase [Gaiellaceae bacterium]|nr:NAD(P)H-dependent glycerol-3-phosphate dehydrogenase [Gaiellaceae bacterium]
MRVAVVGAGAWGTVFAGLLRAQDHDVRLLGYEREEADFDGVDLVVVAVPSRSFAAVVESLPGDAPILSLTKGLDPGTGDRLSLRVQGRSFAVLSGPNFAEEIAKRLPAAAVVASEDEELAVRLQHAINSSSFRVYVNNDPAGVELAAAAKNVIALAAGAIDGLALGDNAKAAVITLGLADMRRLGVATGAKAETFAGLAGTGDLLATCWSRLSRNRRAGALMARGATPQDAVRKLHTVEGLTTAPVLYELSRRLGIELPITHGIADALAGRPIGHVIAEFMRRPPSGE